MPLRRHTSPVCSAALVLALVASVLGALTAQAAPPPRPRPMDTVSGGATTNPLADGPWGAMGSHREVVRAWMGASGERRHLLGKIAGQPRMVWFGHWEPSPGAKVRRYIDEAQAGDPDTYVHLVLFHLFPRELGARHSPLSGREQQRFRAFYRDVAGAIGSSRVIVNLEPDMPIAAYQSPDPGVRLGLARYAARLLGELPNAHVYLDSGSGDWLSVGESAAMLRSAGVEYVNGFALGATHYTKLSTEVEYAADVSEALAGMGIPGKRAIIDTADNTPGYTWLEHRAARPGGDFDNAPLCGTSLSGVCVTLGIPPTHDVANPRWPLSESQRSLALRYVDGYTWFGRPWLYRQASPYQEDRALQVARTTPWQ